MTPTQLSICVYCGSRHGQRPTYTAAARALGTAIGSRGWQLVYGGGKVGLMGEVADATLAAGGRVVGVIPESLQRLEVGHPGLHELHVVPTMHLRKQMMAERSQIFIALPGGIGTLEELRLDSGPQPACTARDPWTCRPNVACQSPPHRQPMTWGPWSGATPRRIPLHGAGSDFP